MHRRDITRDLGNYFTIVDCTEFSGLGCNRFFVEIKADSILRSNFGRNISKKKMRTKKNAIPHRIELITIALASVSWLHWNATIKPGALVFVHGDFYTRFLYRSTKKSRIFNIFFNILFIMENTIGAFSCHIRLNSPYFFTPWLAYGFRYIFTNFSCFSITHSAKTTLSTIHMQSSMLDHEVLSTEFCWLVGFSFILFMRGRRGSIHIFLVAEMISQCTGHSQ